MYQHRDLLNGGDLGMFAVGFAASFASAYFAVRGLQRYISTHDFSVFAWNPIGFAVLVLATSCSGLVNWSAG